MRIIQVIDSLETGGAERIAVNYANALAKRIEFSGLVPTRAEGSLRNQVEANVNYYFIEKRRTLDLRAVSRLRDYCRKNRIDYIHAHSTSYFLAILVKFTYPKIKIIWHDHNGNSEFLEVREKMPLNFASFCFRGIVVVNTMLKDWAERALFCREVIYVPNFINTTETEIESTKLKGISGKRILSVANLREQKDHFMLLDVALKLRETHPDWTFHLVGKDFYDNYSQKVKDFIAANDLGSTVFIYGSRNDVGSIIRQSDIAILTSKSEGLPVALLEYGINKKPVVVTRVGEVPVIIEDGKNGFIIETGNRQMFYEGLLKLVDNPELRKSFGDTLSETILLKNSEEAAMSIYLKWIETL